MEHYFVSFVVTTRRGRATLMLGPDGFDVEAEWAWFQSGIRERLGPEPSFLEPRDALGELRLLTEYQQEYDCGGDFSAVFIEHLKQRCGFKSLEYRDCRLF